MREWALWAREYWVDIIFKAFVFTGQASSMGIGVVFVLLVHDQSELTVFLSIACLPSAIRMVLNQCGMLRMSSDGFE